MTQLDQDIKQAYTNSEMYALRCNFQQLERLHQKSNLATITDMIRAAVRMYSQTNETAELTHEIKNARKAYKIDTSHMLKIQRKHPGLNYSQHIRLALVYYEANMKPRETIKNGRRYHTKRGWLTANDKPTPDPDAARNSERISSVYMLLFSNSDFYIGHSTEILKDRFDKHRNDMKSKNHTKKVQLAYDRYGLPEFIPLKTYLSEHEAQELEKELILEYAPPLNAVNNWNLEGRQE